MKIISCNVNGIRAAYRKGLADLIQKESPDILCFQEIKANREDFPPELIKLKDYSLHTNCAAKKGYSGVAVFSKAKPTFVKKRLGLNTFDNEGRMLEIKFPQFTLVNLYIPHGGRNKEKLGYKLAVYGKLFKHIGKSQSKKLILIGDFNIAHEEIDLARPKGNKNNIMFTTEERRQIDTLIALGFIDTFRIFNRKSGNYTWWPYSHQAKERNIGWRIDYTFVSNNTMQKVRSAKIYPQYRFSDHCPIGIEIY